VYLTIFRGKIKYISGRSCLLRGAVGVLRATLSLRCYRTCYATLRMPNAIKKKRVFARAGLRPALASIRKLPKNSTTSNKLNELFYLVFRVRDSSGKPAAGVACEVQTWHATSLSAHSPTRSAAKGHAIKNKKIMRLKYFIIP